MSDKSPDRNGKSAKAMRLSRRSLMQAGLGVSAAGLLLRGGTLPAFAAEHPALGTYPAGTTGSSVFVGGVMPLTGPYSSSGKDMQLGFEMAVDHLNNGSAVTEQIPTLKKGNGVLGKKIEFQVADIRNQAGSGGRGRDPLHPRQQGDHADRHRQQRGVDRRREARPARARRRHDRQSAAPTIPPARIASVTASAPSRPPIWRRRRCRRCWPRSSASTSRPLIWCPTTPTATASTTR